MQDGWRLWQLALHQCTQRSWGNGPTGAIRSRKKSEKHEWKPHEIWKIWKKWKFPENLENLENSGKSGKFWKKSGKSGKLVISLSKSAPISGGILSLFSTFWKNVTFSKILDFFPKFPLFLKIWDFPDFCVFGPHFLKILLSRRHTYATRPTFVRPTWAGPDGDSYLQRFFSNTIRVAFQFWVSR